MATNTYYSPFFPTVQEPGAKGTTIAPVPSGVVNDIANDVEQVKGDVGIVIKDIVDINKILQDLEDGTTPIVDTVPPAVPTGLAGSSTITDQGASLNFNWVAPTDDDLAGYDLAIKQGSGGYIEYVTTSASYQFNALPRNVSFTAKVRAFDKAGNRSGWTSEVTIVTVRDTVAPAAPNIIGVESAFQTANIRWTNGNETDLDFATVYLYGQDGVTSLDFKRTAASQGGGALIWVGLAKGTNYKVRVTLTDTSGNVSGLSNVYGFTTAGGIDIGDFTPGLSPTGTVATLPDPSTWTGAKLVFNQADSKLYNLINGQWVAAVAQAVGDVQLQPNSVKTENLVDYAVNANKLKVSIGGGNLVSNSSFERYFNAGLGAIGHGYSYYDNSGGTEGAYWDVQANGRRGGFSQLIGWSKNTSTKGIFLNAAGNVNNAGLMKPNTTYIFSFYARGAGSATAGGMGLAFNTFPGYSIVANPVISTDWQRYVFKLVTGSTADPSIFITTAVNSNNAGYIYIDDIQLEEGDVVTAYSPALLPGEVTGDLIAPNAITETKIAPDSITTPAIAALAITANKIATNTITANQIAARGITADRIQAYSLTATEIAANTIRANNLSVSTRPFSIYGGAFRVDTDGVLRWNSCYVQYVDDSANYVSVDVQGGAIAPDGQVWYLYYTPGTHLIYGTHVEQIQGDPAVFFVGKWHGTQDSLNLSVGAGTLINGAQIITGSIYADKIVARSIGADRIVSGSITGNEIQAGTITAAQIATGSLTTRTLAIGNPDNIITDGDFRDKDFWTAGSMDSRIELIDLDFTSFARGLRIIPSGGIAAGTRYFAAEPGATYRVTIGVVLSSDFSGYFRPLIHIPNERYQSLRRNNASVAADGNDADAFNTAGFSDNVSVVVDNPMSQYGRSWQVLFRGSWTGAVRFSISIVRVSDTTLIKDGAITTNKIIVGSLNGDRITTGTLDANTIKAGSVLSGSVTVDGGSLSAIKAIAQDGMGYIEDTRASDFPPSYYYAKGRRTVYEFKQCTTMGILAGGNYGTLTTLIQWDDASGGPVQQSFVDSAGRTWNRFSANESAWGAWADAGAQVNRGVTQIDPGKITVSGGTTLANWRQGGDDTKIAGGSISANTISANKLTVGNRGIGFIGLNFEWNPNNNWVYWSDGYIYYVNDSGNPDGQYINAGNSGGAGAHQFFYWTKGSGTLSMMQAQPVGDNIVMIASWWGGTNLNVNYGGTIIHGDRITTGTINANRITAGTVLAANIQVGGDTLGKLNGIEANANRITNTNQLSDGAALGQTALWSNVANNDGNRPQNGATVGAPAGTYVGNTESQQVANWAYTGARDPAERINNIETTTINGGPITTGTITASQIAALSITGDKIQANTITASQLRSDFLAASWATIGTLRTAASGARLELEANQIRGYYANGNLAFRMGVF